MQRVLPFGSWRISLGSSPWLALAMGLLAFWAWAGAYTLAPGHIGWVMSGLDTQTQYLAWQFFRHATWWQWPLGANLAYGSDAPGSIVLSDSIPLVALAFKTVSPLLATRFQYFGLWALSCFLLQGWFACKLMGRVTDDPVVQLAGTGFFLAASIFLVRLYLHPALAAQWMLLAGFYLLLDARFRYRPWLMLLCLAILVHAYLFVMVAAIWSGDMCQRLWRKDCSAAEIVRHAVVTAIGVTLLMWAAGYFMPSSVTSTALRTHFDLWAPFWTGIRGWGEWSWFLPASDLDLLAADGFSYLGLGFMLLLGASVVVRFLPMAGDGGGRIRKSSWCALLAVCGLLFAYSLGDKITVSHWLLLSYREPGWLEKIHGVFRAAARMAWPAWYLLLLAAIYGLLKSVGARRGRYILVAALVLQLIDLSRGAVDTRAEISKGQTWHSVMHSDAWKQLASQHRHMVYLQPATVSAAILSWGTGYREVANYAALNDMTINIAYLSREDELRLARARVDRLAQLLRGISEPSTIYVVEEDMLWKQFACAQGAGQWHGIVDGFRLLVANPPPGIGPMPALHCDTEPATTNAAGSAVTR